MATVHMPHLVRNHPDAARSVSDAFWVVALGLIGAYAFFAALGAFSPGDVLGVTIAVAILAALWCWRALASARRGAEPDPHLAHERERRGF